MLLVFLGNKPKRKLCDCLSELLLVLLQDFGPLQALLNALKVVIRLPETLKKTSYYQDGSHLYWCIRGTLSGDSADATICLVTTDILGLDKTQKMLVIYVTVSDLLTMFISSENVALFISFLPH